MTYRYWTTLEVAYLRKWCGIVPDATIAAVLGRTPAGVRLEAQQIGLDHKPGKQAFIEAGRRELKETAA